jgi:arylsulfatase A
MFNESWIHAIKTGGYTRYQLYDRSNDPEQKADLSSQFPDIVARLKNKMLEINASVLADGPDWVVK